MAAQVWFIGPRESILVCGGSGQGKSTFVEKLITDPKYWKEKFDKILYCYGIYSKTVESLSKNAPHIQLISGLPRNLLANPLQVLNPQENSLIVLDDVSLESQESKELTSFISRGLSHTNSSLISIEHFLFSPLAQRRNQSFHYSQIILFKSSRNLNQLNTLAKQLGICTAKELIEAYKDSTQKPYSHLVLDLRSDTPDDLRILSNVLCENEEPTYAYSCTI